MTNAGHSHFLCMKILKGMFQRLRGLAGRVNRLGKKKKQWLRRTEQTGREWLLCGAVQVTWMTGIRSAYPGEEAS